MRKKIEWKWEKLDDDTSRVKVIGGWIIRSRTNKTESMVFIVDRDHEHHVIPPISDAEPVIAKVNPNDFAAK